MDSKVGTAVLSALVELWAMATMVTASLLLTVMAVQRLLRPARRGRQIAASRADGRLALPAQRQSPIQQRRQAASSAGDLPP